ncbi:voltage-gated potassium channel [Desulfatibacillum alkenivorans DSM 16219]|jgi:voltage-gated potassium channel|uniref:Voltage-gated potassium channel n=1 Tax=Desulfatibacillum alkenivorans DSM 16219 TaxID=1121393 RepID=A0A1M6I5Y8_9BACT|nr:potassium channel protein [Desulfatibacillum alkenivorans]SHJ29848.1 voltage-gated potassium channel [Desulfatibacillum alkenivorans DSM 16219]
MEQARHFRTLILMTVFVILGGSVGFMIIEGWSFLDALYMTIITISTVGYKEVGDLDENGRFFVIIFIFFGVGLFMYAVAFIAQFMVEGRLREILGRRKLENQIKKLKNHYVVCGYGRIGSVLCKDLIHGKKQIVVVEQEEKYLESLNKEGILYLLADATDEETLIQAGIKQARGLVAALGSDAQNVFVVLTARQLNPDLFIMARANVQSSMPKLMAAGSNKVVSPHDIGAKRMADGILHPNVTDFLELASCNTQDDINMEEIPVAEDSKLAGVALFESNIRKDLNLIIIAIKKSDGAMSFNPEFSAIITPGDTVIAVGKRGNLSQLEKILNP